MTDYPSADQILAMSPTEASAALDAMTAAYRGAPPPDVPTNAAGAAARLELLASDGIGAQLLNNDAAAEAEFGRLTAMASKMSEADLAIAGCSCRIVRVE